MPVDASSQPIARRLVGRSQRKGAVRAPAQRCGSRRHHPAHGGPGGSALADGNGQFKKIPVSFTGGPDLPGAVPGGRPTTDCTTVACVCRLQLRPRRHSAPATSWATTSRCSLSAHRQAAAGPSSPGTGGFTGSVKRCGTGTFVWTESGVVSADGSYEGVQTIFPGSGTGDLVGITGSWKKSSTSAT